MEGLSYTRRRIYLWTLAIVFIIIAPILVLYASGYRLSDDFTVVETGGIYVQVGESGAALYVDDTYVGRGNIFQKSFFEQNLSPDTYTVSVQKPEHHTWNKQLPVYPQRVSEAEALLVAMAPEHIRIVPDVSDTEQGIMPLATTTASTTERISADAFADITAAFADVNPDAFIQTPNIATTSLMWRGATTTAYVRGNIGMWQAADGVYVRWLGELDEIPYQFCANLECRATIQAYAGNGTVLHAAFVPGSNRFFIIERTDGIFVSELDTRPPHNTFPIYAVSNARMLVVDEDIYVKDANEIFRISY